MNVYDDFEYIRWIRGLGSERLPTASYALLSTLKKVYFLPSGRNWECLSSVFYRPVNKYFCIRLLASARHVSPAVLWTLWPGGGSEPLTSAPCSEFMTQSLILSIYFCRGLGISPLRIKHSAEFFSGRSWPKICPGIMFFGFFGEFGFFFWEDLCS